MVLKKHRINTDVLIIDASKGYIKAGKSNKLRACDIKKISDTVAGRLDIPKYSKRISRDTIRDNTYNLNIPRYVDSSEKAESWDIYASVFGGIPKAVINELKEFWDAFPTLKTEIFAMSDTPFSSVTVQDIKSTIIKNTDVKALIEKYNQTFGDFEKYLENRLIENMQTIDIFKEEGEIAEDIFIRLENIPLVDQYQAYQLFYDDWAIVATDLEIIQSEGFEATKKIDPIMITKKDKGKDVEVQDSWTGRIISFELVQQTLLKNQVQNLTDKENKLLEITSTYEEIIDSLTEEDKDKFSDCFNEDKTAFVSAAVIKTAKTLEKSGDSYDGESLEQKIITSLIR